MKAIAVRSFVYDKGRYHTQNEVERVKLGEFVIGREFWCGEQAWRCTDIGTRIITAIKLNHDDDPKLVQRAALCRRGNGV